MYGYVRNGKMLHNNIKAIDRVHIINDGAPLCGVSVHLFLTEHRNGKPICGGCRAQIKKNETAARLQAEIQRSQELFS